MGPINHTGDPINIIVRLVAHFGDTLANAAAVDIHLLSDPANLPIDHGPQQSVSVCLHVPLWGECQISQPRL